MVTTYNNKATNSSVSNDAIDLCAMLHVLINLGRTEAEIAKYCGLHQSSISRIRSGRIKNPNYKAIKKLERLYQDTLQAHIRS